MVFPVGASGRQVLFASTSGLRIRWDGESIISIEGMPGAFGRYQSGLEVDRNQRWYAQAGFPVVRADCSPPIVWRVTADHHGWRQECIANVGKQTLKASHSVEIGRDGKIKLIEAASRPGAANFSLRRID